MRQEAPQDRGGLEDVEEPEAPEDQEPGGGDGSERPGDAGRAPGLDHEEDDEDGRRDRQHQAAQLGADPRGVPQALDGAEDGDGGGDDPVAIEQGRPDHSEEQHCAGTHRKRPLGQGHEGQGAALALVVRAHEEGDVFDGHHQDEGPGDQGDDAQNRQFGGHVGPGMGEGLAHGVEGAGPDVPEDHAQGAQGQGCKAFAMT